MTSGNDNGDAVCAAVQCREASRPGYTNTKRDNQRVYWKAPSETWGYAWYNAPCLTRPAKHATRPLRIDWSKVKSAQMINETLDGAMPYSGSLEVRRRHPNAVLIGEPGVTTHAESRRT